MVLNILEKCSAKINTENPDPDPYPDPYIMYTDPKHCLTLSKSKSNNGTYNIEGTSRHLHMQICFLSKSHTAFNSTTNKNKVSKLFLLAFITCAKFLRGSAQKMFLISRVTTTLHCTVVVHYDIMWNNRKTSDHIKFCTNIWTNQNRRVIWTCRLTWTFLYIFWRLIFDTPSRAWHKRGKNVLKTYTSFNRIIEDIVFPTPPQNIIPSWWKVWTIRHFSKSNLDREGQTWKKLYKIHNDPPF